MFEASVKAKRFETGQTLEGTIVAIGPEGAFVDVGGKGEATIEIAELKDDDRNPFSQLMLAKAYQAAGNESAASEVKDSVLTLHRLDIDLWIAQEALKNK